MEDTRNIIKKNNNNNILVLWRRKKERGDDGRKCELSRSSIYTFAQNDNDSLIYEPKEEKLEERRFLFTFITLHIHDSFE